MHPVPLSQREQRPLTLSRLCPGQRPGTVCAGEGSEPLWGMKTGAGDLGYSWRCNQAPKRGETEERGSPFPPSPGFPWDFLLLARQSLEDLGFWVGTGAPGLGFWGDEYSSARTSLCFCLLSREGLGFRFTLTPGGAESRYPLSHLFLLHLQHSCSYPAHLV